MSLVIGCPLVQPVIGVPYSQAVPVAGGTPPYTITVSVGPLPPGLSLAGGIISGTPTAAGSVSYTLQVVDSIPTTKHANCTLVVLAQAVSAAIQLPNPPFSTPIFGNPSAQTDKDVILGNVPEGIISDPWRGYFSQQNNVIAQILAKLGMS